MATGPTPLGVPVKIKSPVRNVKNFDRYEIMYENGKSNKLVLPCCLSFPSTSNLKLMFARFLNSLTGINLSDIGAEPLKPLAISQGKPFSLSFC